VLNQGCTAHYLAHDAHPIREGDRVLIHAAAGGVGSNLVQMAKRLGAYVYATVSTEEKLKFARALGADEVFVTSADDFEEKVRRATDGRGVDAVFDAIGGDTFMKSMRSLARKGHLVTYGKTAGAPPPIEWPPQVLGSLYLSYHTGQDYSHRGEQAQQRASTVFRWVLEGSLRVNVYAEYALNDAASAHRALESRKTTGKLLLFTA
jgi:NADPH2:quinone reductase